MIDCVTMATAHLFGNALASQHRLRHRVFIQAQGWAVPSWNGMEYDQYDTPAAHYLTWRDERGEVRGVSRLAPTDRPYMLKDIWPEMVSNIELPASLAVWEGTRFGIDRDLPTGLCKRIVAEIVLGYIEFGLSNGIEQYIGIMPPAVWRLVFSGNGWRPEFLGEPTLIDGDRILAGRVFVSRQALAEVRQRTGIHGTVLRTADDILNHRTAA